MENEVCVQLRHRLTFDVVARVHVMLSALRSDRNDIHTSNKVYDYVQINQSLYEHVT